MIWLPIFFVTTTTWELASCNEKLVCLRLYWYCTEKFYVGHSWDSKDWAVYYYGLALIMLPKDLAQSVSFIVMIHFKWSPVHFWLQHGRLLQFH